MSFGLFSFILSGMYFLLVKTRLFIVYVPLFLCKASNVNFDLTMELLFLVIKENMHD